MNNKKLNDLENRILIKLCEAVSTDLANVIAEQVNQIQYVQRICRGVETDVYYYKPGLFRRKSKKVPVIGKFSDGELCLASIVIKNLNENKKYCCNVWIVNGLFFSFEFNFNSLDVNCNSLVVCEVENHENDIL